MSTLEDTPDQPAPEELIDEHRELFERIADADLPISDRIARALDRVDQERETDV